MKDDTELMLLFAADRCYSCGRDRGDIWYLYNFKLWTLPQPVSLWGCKMDLLRDSPFTLLLCLSSLPRSTTLWGAHSLTQGFFLWQLCRSKEEALGELILCQAALAVALISSWKSLGLAEDSATDKSWSPDLSPASLITPGPLKYLGASSFLSRWWRDSAMEELRSCNCPNVGLSSLSLKVRGNSLILRLAVQYLWKRNHFFFLPHTFSSCHGLTQDGN